MTLTAGTALFTTLSKFLYDTDVPKGASRVDILKVISHHKKDNDAAIIKLKSPLTFNSRVKPACLPNRSFAPEKNGEVAAIVSGWGRLYEGNDNKNYSLNFYLHLIFDILYLSLVFFLVPGH